jgi:hypothetical protein
MCLMVGPGAGPAFTQQLDDAAVNAAIKAGQTKEYSDLISDCSAQSGFGEGMVASMTGGVTRSAE